jgi:dTMP kinase
MSAEIMKIAIVGCDGAGKSSMTRFVERGLLTSGYSTRRIDKWDVVNADLHPGYDFLCSDLRNLRRRVSQMRSVTRTFFLFWTLHGTLSPERLVDTQVVLLDGYWAKHAASETLYSHCGALIDAAVKTLPVPELTIFLDVDPEVAYNRRISDATTPLVPYECGLDEHLRRGSFLSHQTACRQILTSWCASLRWVKIDANREAIAVQLEIASLLRSHGLIVDLRAPLETVPERRLV